MSGQLEVHHSALCTAPVSLNLCCCGPYPQPGHSPWEAATLRPILLWQLHSTRSNAKHYCVVYMVTLYFCLYQLGDCVSAKPGRAGGEKWHSGKTLKRKIMREVTEDETMKKKKKKTADRLWTSTFDSNLPTSLSHTSKTCVYSKVMSVPHYRSWCLFLWELLRVVTVLEFSSCSSSSFAFRASLKNLKMDLKLIQEVSSCLSVPLVQTTNTKIVAYCLLQGWKSA